MATSPQKVVFLSPENLDRQTFDNSSSFCNPPSPKGSDHSSTIMDNSNPRNLSDPSKRSDLNNPNHPTHPNTDPEILKLEKALRRYRMLTNLYVAISVVAVAVGACVGCIYGFQQLAQTPLDFANPFLVICRSFFIVIGHTAVGLVAGMVIGWLISISFAELVDDWQSKLHQITNKLDELTHRKSRST